MQKKCAKHYPDTSHRQINNRNNTDNNHTWYNKREVGEHTNNYDPIVYATMVIVDATKDSTLPLNLKRMIKCTTQL